MSASALPLKLAPSLLSADFAAIAEQIRTVEGAGADELHLDSMDGVFVPNFTWGMKIVADLRKLTRLPFDCHLMIVEPEKYVDAFREAGADVITFHYEATPHADRLLRRIRESGAKAGIAINPGTPVAMLDDLAEEIDRVLVMSVNPGFGGQSFIERALTKIAEARALLDARNPACEIEVDGGIGLENAARAVQAGANVLVAGNSVFGAGDPAAALRGMRSAAAAR
ncbi:MAG TPA: ribulose-phosphate 3-epimerase [Candidatus Elarobacter sp.]|nr:ribulose-phosphate 3-epimerase [Candidatus Elarobacter sp.]